MRELESGLAALGMGRQRTRGRVDTGLRHGHQRHGYPERDRLVPPAPGQVSGSAHICPLSSRRDAVSWRRQVMEAATKGVTACLVMATVDATSVTAWSVAC